MTLARLLTQAPRFLLAVALVHLFLNGLSLLVNGYQLVTGSELLYSYHLPLVWEVPVGLVNECGYLSAVVFARGRLTAERRGELPGAPRRGWRDGRRLELDSCFQQAYSSWGSAAIRVLVFRWRETSAPFTMTVFASLAVLYPVLS